MLNLGHKAALLVAALAIGSGGLGGCQARMAPESPRPQADTAQVRSILTSELKKKAPGFTRNVGTPGSRGLPVFVDTSIALPGVAYHWMGFAPPNTGHVMIHVVAASVGTTLIPIGSPADWNRAAAFAGWRPRDEASAVRACADLVRVAGPAAGVVWQPTMFTDPATLSNRSVRGAHLLAPRIARPVTEPAEGGWNVIAWFLESGRTTQYRCRIRPRTGASYEVLRTIDGFGYPEF